MTTADAEPVAGPSHGNSQVMRMRSGLHLHPSQQLQLLPVSVQQLAYEDVQFHDDDGGGGGDDDDDDGTQADGGGSQLMSVNSSQNLTSSYASTMV